MTDKTITANDLNEVPTQYRIQTSVPRDKVTDKMILDRVQNAKMGPGDHLLVQCMNHDKNTILHEAVYLVVAVTEEFVSVALNDREIKQGVETSVVIQRKGDWFATLAAPSAPEIRWNPGAQAHEVVSGDTVLASFGKAEGGKDAAEAFIRGDKAAA